MNESKQKTDKIYDFEKLERTPEFSKIVDAFNEEFSIPAGMPVVIPEDVIKELTLFPGTIFSCHFSVINGQLKSASQSRPVSLVNAVVRKAFENSHRKMLRSKDKKQQSLQWRREQYFKEFLAGRTYAQIARMYGRAPSTIRGIVRGEAKRRGYIWTSQSHIRIRRHFEVNPLWPI